jgi:hypothetical protein
MADKGNVVYNSSKLIFITGPFLLLLCLVLSIYHLYVKMYFYFAIFAAIFLLILFLFLIINRKNRETVWENCAGILNFPSPIPRMIWFKDVEVAYPLYSYSPSTKKMVTAKLCLIDKGGNLFVIKNLDAVTASIIGLSKRWKKVYVPDYDIQNLTRGQQARMKMLMDFSNNTARLIKFLMFFLFGGLVILIGYFVLSIDIGLYLFIFALLFALVAYFGSIFLIGAILIQRENAKRKIMRMKQSKLTKKLDRGLLKKFLSSDVPDYDGDYDMFTEIAVEFGKGPPREEVKPVENSKAKKGEGEKKGIGYKKKKGRTKKGSKRSAPSKYSKKP